MASATTAISDQYRFHAENSPTAQWAITNLTRHDVLSVLTGEATVFETRLRLSPLSFFPLDSGLEL